VAGIVELEEGGGVEREAVDAAEVVELDAGAAELVGEGEEAFEEVVGMVALHVCS
jgi:hypothetical protein